MTREIKVDLGKRSYSIFIQNGLLRKAGPYIKRNTKTKKIIILSTRSIYELFGKSLYKSLKNEGIDSSLVLIKDGEKNKNEKSLFYVLKKMAQQGFQRSGCLIALGGGVVGDLGGLAAALYMRGIDFVQCPTTLLAQVDASIGGKTAIDFLGVKNLIGAFHQPKCVLIDPEALQTLNERQYKTGLAEIIKYGVIGAPSVFEDFEKHLKLILRRDPTILLRLISKSCELKAKIVSDDERESGMRAWLNYGHTLGHALEAYYGYKILTHGEAVAYGMWFASLISKRLHLSSGDVMRRQVSILKNVGLFRQLPPFNPRKIYQKMLLDKKARDGQIQFVLTRKIGLVTIQKNIPHPIIFSTLIQLQGEANKRR